MKNKILLFLLIIANLFVFSQKVTNVQVEEIGEKFHVTYSLDKMADITLHLSTDGGVTYSEPLKQVTGDVGKNIPAGTHTIVWDMLADKYELVGEDIVFNVKANYNRTIPETERSKAETLNEANTNRTIPETERSKAETLNEANTNRTIPETERSKAETLNGTNYNRTIPETERSKAETLNEANTNRTIPETERPKTKPLNEANSKRTITETVNGVTFEMIYVEGGTFKMGCTSEQGTECYSNEKPAHQVTLSNYYIGKFEVTQALWQAVMGYNPSNFKGSNLPVENVCWEDIHTFISKLNSLTGHTYRLPTEAEWEYAARGGKNSNGYKYSGSNFIDEVGWCNYNSSSTTHSVGTKLPNELGIYDMSGNVNEWCKDWYDSYTSNSQTNPKGASRGYGSVSRSGCWMSFERECRVSSRGYGNANFRNDFHGFRLVRVQ